MESRAQANVLLVIVDEWRAQSFGYAGDTNAHTPVIDSFAESSINYENAIAGTPVCCPSRASFFTGQYATEHGVYINDVPLVTEKPGVADVFAESGYSTGYIGKWHLLGSPDGWFAQRSAFVPPERRLGFQYWKAGECSHDYWNSIYYAGDDTQPRVWEGYDAFSQTDDAVSFMTDAAQSDAPFFLTVSYGPPHFPLETAPPKYQEMYQDREISLRDNVPERNREQAVADLRGYYAHMAAIDDCFGTLLEALDDLDLASDTIVVFTSDHGDMMWSQGLEFKLVPWEESIAVPMLVRAPDRASAVSGALFNSPDLMPTLLGLAGLDVPPGLSGKDFSHSMEAEGTAYLMMPASFSSLLWYGIDEYRGVRDERYTYVETRKGPWLLYDRVTDPFQLTNLVDEPSARDQRTRLAAELQRWRTQLDDEFLAGDDYIERDGLRHHFTVNEPWGYSSGPNGQWQSTNERGRRWCIDTPIDMIHSDAAARAVLEEAVPALVHDLSLSDGGRDSIRLVAMLHVGFLSQALLNRVDEKLWALGSRDGDDIDDVSRDRIFTKASRSPAEYHGPTG
jgi:arylsulfatase A-like enzyme